MKGLILATAVAGLAIVSPLSAQGRARTSTVDAQSRQNCQYQPSNPVGVILGRGTNTSTNCTYSGNGSVDGQWRAVGQDRNGNTIYQRRTYDGNGNILVQRAVRDSYGRMSIIDSRTYNANGNGAYNKGRANGHNKYKKHKNNRNDGDADDQGNRGYNDPNYRYDQFGNRVYVGPATNSSRDHDHDEWKKKDHGKGKGRKDRD